MLTTHGVAEGEWDGNEWIQYRWSAKVKDSDVYYWLCLEDLTQLEKEGDSLQQEQPDFPSNLEEAAEEYANKEYPDEPCVGRWGTGDYEPPVDNEYPREIAKDAFKAGADAIVNQKVSLGYLISWYIQSVDRHQPIWTEDHLKELDKDFILIPKSLNNP